MRRAINRPETTTTTTSTMAAAGDRYGCATGNIWSYAHRGDLTGVKAALLRGGSGDNKNTNNNLINLPNTVGWTALHAAAAGGQPKILRFLLREGADFTIADHGGNTAVHQAAKHGHVQALRVLESFGADLTTVRLSQAKGMPSVTAWWRHSVRHQMGATWGMAGQMSTKTTHHPLLLGMDENKPNRQPFWGPRKTPISGKIKRNILKQRRQKKQSQQQKTEDVDTRETNPVTEKAGQKDDECASIEEDTIPSQKECLDRAAIIATDGDAPLPPTVSYHQTVQAVKRNKKQRRKGRQKQKDVATIGRARTGKVREISCGRRRRSIRSVRVRSRQTSSD
ncbi:MAG: ankyrin repeat domain-containing protein [Caldilineaceae bacterium]|nr:ankyrin repeat domain-containing protein [Caldilineaceae bacterium]